MTLMVGACGGGPSAGQTGSPRSAGTPGTTPAGGGGASPGSGQATADELCALLTADDWGEFNYVTAAEPEVNEEDPGSATCVYAGESGARGGLELDAYQHATPAEAEETFDTIAESMPDATDAALPGADESLIQLDIPGSFAAIVVRSGRFTYTIALPAGDEAETQLNTLAATVLARSQSLH
jgi:hypothetical protein